jgi:cob(I)alamin adenosyltransferase
VNKISGDRRGLVVVYTGNGKGKTTAALGLVLRAVGHGHTVFIIQFMKGGEIYGEIRAIRSHLPGVTIESWGRETFVNKEHPDPIDVDLAQRALARAGEIIRGGRHDLVVLDEVNVALDFRLIDLGDVFRLIDARPPCMDLVLTGRYAPPALVERADLVSEVLDIKHHYADGIPAREGMEY